MPKVVLASNNQGKIRELNDLLKLHALEVISQSVLGVADIKETGTTFIENAIIKARHATRATGLPAIADDSGLTVDALHGSPGIYSARYSGPNAASADNIAKLLREMEKVPDENRHARFHCVLVYMSHALDPMPLVCMGSWEGVILREPQGNGGFGYDPVFYLPELKKSAAELSPEVKNTLSHRGVALRALIAAMQGQS